MFSMYSQVRSRTYAWYVTFGDLLTLLVCFFLVLTHGTPTGLGENPYKQVLSDENLKVDTNGTALASQKKTFDLEGQSFLVVSEREVHSGQFEKRVADRFANCLDSHHVRNISASVSLCRSFLAEDKRSASVVQGVYEAVSSALACIGKVVVRFDKGCLSDDLMDRDSIGSVEFIISELSDDRRV